MAQEIVPKTKHKSQGRLIMAKINVYNDTVLLSATSLACLVAFCGHVDHLWYGTEHLYHSKVATKS